MATLNEYAKRPLTQNIDISELPVKDLMARFQEYFDKIEGEKEAPEHEALKFYLMNHAMAIVRHRVDPNAPLKEYERIVQMFHDELKNPVLRMFFYMVIICAREARHVRVCDVINEKNPTNEFIKDIRGECPSVVYARLKIKPPAIPVGEFVKQLERIFYQGKFSSGSFGGPAWGRIAKCLRKFVHGEISAEILMDTAFTLCHNGGPIFNKGYLYTGQSCIKHILDVQASGQIPHYIFDDSSMVTDEIKQMHAACAEAIGSSFRESVDPSKIKSGKGYKPGSEIPLEGGSTSVSEYEVVPGVFVEIEKRGAS